MLYAFDCTAAAVTRRGLCGRTGKGTGLKNSGQYYEVWQAERLVAG